MRSLRSLRLVASTVLRITRPAETAEINALLGQPALAGQGQWFAWAGASVGASSYPMVASKIRADAPPTLIIRPEGLHAAVANWCIGSVKTSSSRPVLESQTRTVRSSLPETNLRPSGL